MRDLSSCYRLIRLFEGCKLHAYKDSVGVDTIGYGTTVGVHPGMAITQQQAEHLLEMDVAHRAAQLATWIHVPVSDNQMSAIISLAYNIGMHAIYHSRLLTDINAGQPKAVCAKDFLSWTHAGGRVLPGLTNRRKAEAAIFVS